MTCSFCRDIGVECDCDEGPCPDCAEMLESTDDLEDKLSAALDEPAVRVSDWKSVTPNVQNLSGGTNEKAGLVVLDVCGTDVQVLRNKTIPESSSLADALLYLLLYILHDEYFTPAFKSRFEAVAGPCEYMQVGTSLYIKILTPNADGVCLELSIDF